MNKTSDYKLITFLISKSFIKNYIFLNLLKSLKQKKNFLAFLAADPRSTMKKQESSMTVPEKPNNLNPREAIELIGQYLPKEWKYLNDEDVNTKRLQYVLIVVCE